MTLTLEKLFGQLPASLDLIVPEHQLEISPGDLVGTEIILQLTKLLNRVGLPPDIGIKMIAVTIERKVPVAA